MLDLAGLGPLKERLATYHLLARSSEKMPELRRVIKESATASRRQERRLSEIVRRAAATWETNQLIIPPKFAQPYSNEFDLPQGHDPAAAQEQHAAQGDGHRQSA